MMEWWRLFWTDTQVFVNTLLAAPLIVLLVAFVVFVIYSTWEGMK